MTLINPNISDVFILFILSMIALFKLSIVLVVSVSSEIFNSYILAFISFALSPKIFMSISGILFILVLLV